MSYTPFQSVFATYIAIWSNTLTHDVGLIIAQYNGADYVNNNRMQSSLVTNLMESLDVTNRLQNIIRLDFVNIHVLMSDSVCRFILNEYRSYHWLFVRSKVQYAHDMTYPHMMDVEYILKKNHQHVVTTMFTRHRAELAEIIIIPSGFVSLWQRCESLDIYHNSLKRWQRLIRDRQFKEKFVQTFNMPPNTQQGRDMKNLFNRYNAVKAQGGSLQRHQVRQKLLATWESVSKMGHIPGGIQPDRMMAVDELCKHRVVYPSIIGDDLHIMPDIFVD
ncbi:MAG: hypothetical protein Faunusvirus2_53 [Faunusvirus sp.]|jgi:hypothetical protein|uniref:Uncharacterized protein n=1 Tax=Faunusvirus sp. TaxID=2487766 RepID=A0A3G4ZW46_9VIRU|nr:MAG: hypothetical protein Faunusvirus2_53 [Faunusvirus sp.]